ncbi:MAG: hypothetical protein KIT43_02780 [Bauldia sp.]|nr:hypothetical protein [Bauldia sp.]MCW5719229.1 hypothetical protein [Bauldia sp.]
MKRTILAAGLLAATSFAIPAYALDVHILAEGEVNAILGTPAGEATANLVVGINEDAVAPTEITIAAQGDATATVTPVTEVVGWQVFTSDGVAFGAVIGVAVANDGEALLIVDLNDGWVTGIETIAIRTSALVRTADGVEIDDTEAELKASLAGGAEVTPAVELTPAPTPPPTP